MSTPTCPHCGSNTFRIRVLQDIVVDFTEDDHVVMDGPMGDMEWDDTAVVQCNTCDHRALLSQMVAP